MAMPLALVWDLIARDNASATFARVGTSAETNSKRVRGMAEALGAIAAVDIGAHMVKMAGQFQQSTNVLVTAAGESTKNLKLIRQGILDIATGTGTSWKAVTDGIYGVEKAGYRGADALKIMKAAAQGAREEGANLATVTQAMTSVMASYHLGAGDSVKVMNEMKTAAGEAKTSMELFSGSLSTVLPLASANKISFADIAGSLASLTQHGTSADEAAQELAFTMRGLAAPNQVAVKEMAQLGLSSVDVAQKLGDGPGGRGLAGTLNYLSQTVLQRMGPAGTLLLSTFNQSKVAAADAQREFGALAPSTKEVAQEFLNGTITSKQWVIAVKNMTPAQANLARQWATTQNAAHGFQQIIRTGGSAAQTYSDALKKMTGGANGLNTVLQLTGGSMVGTNERIAAIQKSAAGAGKDVSGWASTQKLFNVQMDMFKQRIDAAGIKLGTTLLPAVSGTVKVLSSLFDWTSRYGKIIGPVALGIGGLALAVWGVNAATAAWTATMAALDAVLAINPIVAIGIAIAALVVGVIEAYKHSKTFRDVIHDAWTAVKTVISGAWHDVIKPVFDGLKTGLNALTIAWRDTWGAVKTAWTAVYPVIKVIGEIVYAAIGGAVIGAIWVLKKEWAQLWAGVKFAWNDIGKPVFDVIKAHWGIILAGLTGGLSLLLQHWRTTWMVLKTVWRDVGKPVFDAVAGGWLLLWNVVKAAWNTVGHPAVSAVGTAINAVWVMIKPVFTRISSAWSALWRGMKVAFTSVWGGVQGAISVSIGGVVGIINDFIGAIDWILNKLPGHLHIDKIPWGGAKNTGGGGAGSHGIGSTASYAYATGGVLPGWSPGYDNIEMPAYHFSGGEGILVPEATRALGGESGIKAINSMFSNRVSAPGHFAGGGILGAAESVLGGIRHGLAAVAGAALTTAEGPVRAGIRAIPGETLRDIIGGLFQNVDHALRTLINGKAHDAAVANAKAAAASGGGPVPTGAHMALIAQALKLAGVGVSPMNEAAVNLIVSRESGWNAGAINLTDSNAQAGHPSQGLMQTIPSTFEAYRLKSLPDVITDPLANLVAGIRYAVSRYGSVTGVPGVVSVAHGGGYVGYDAGGWLQPGITPTINRSGKPEAVLTHEESMGLKAMVSGRQGPLIHVEHIDTTVDLELVARDAQFRERAGHFG